MPATNPIPAISPVISWEKDGEIQSLPWRSENNWAPPKRTVLADDTMTADIAYRLASEGVGLIWPQNPKTPISVDFLMINKR